MATEVLLPAVPFDSEETVDSQGNITYDRVAYSADYAKWWKTYFSNGILVNGGGNLTTEFQVSLKTTPTVTVKAGAVVINGRTGWLDADVDIAMPVASGSVKHFMVVLELNIPNDRQIAIKVVEDKTYASIMDGSALVQTDDIFQIPLAMVQQNSSGVINAVTDLRTKNQKWISNVNIGVSVPDDISDLPLTPETANIYGLTGDKATYDNALKALGGYGTLHTFTTSQIWTVPEGVSQIFVLCVGGGGGGGYGKSDSTKKYGSGGGGGAGYIASAQLKVKAGEQYSINIGAGGSGGVYSNSSNSKKDPTRGGTTSFGDAVFAAGGFPGLIGDAQSAYSETSYGRGSAGGGAMAKVDAYNSYQYGGDGGQPFTSGGFSQTMGTNSNGFGYGRGRGIKDTILLDSTLGFWNLLTAQKAANLFPYGGAGGGFNVLVADSISDSNRPYSGGGGSGGIYHAPSSSATVLYDKKDGMNATLAGSGGGGGAGAYNVSSDAPSYSKGGNGANGAVYIFYHQI